MEKDIKDKVLTSLNLPKYDWRTVSGIALELGQTEQLVLETILSLGDLVIKASQRGPDNKELYTSRKKYYSSRNLFSKILTAVSGSIK